VEKAVGNGVERFAEVQLNNVHSSSHFSRRCFDFVVEGDVSLARFALGKFVLAFPLVCNRFF